MTEAAILWRRLDLPGHEAARLAVSPPGWSLSGTAVFADQGQACLLSYQISVDAGWRTRFASVIGWVGAQTIDVAIAVEAGAWQLNGAPCPAVTGCLDLDLSFSPSTNLLPIRRLNLAAGQSASVRAAWLRFPGFRLEPVEQTYRREGEASYVYESGDFAARLLVSPAGFVTQYEGLWQADARAP